MLAVVIFPLLKMIKNPFFVERNMAKGITVYNWSITNTQIFVTTNPSLKLISRSFQIYSPNYDF